jgi:CheY-like chemotaxis protein
MATDLLMKEREQFMRSHIEDTFNAINPPAPESLLVSNAGSPALCEWRGTETILLVEDEHFVRRAIVEALEAAGYNSLPAPSAAQALAILQATTDPLDLLLADIVMPSVNGYDLAMQFLTLLPETRILLMSGYEEQVIRCEQMRSEIQYIAKPFSIPTLLQRVRQILDSEPCNLPAHA